MIVNDEYGKWEVVNGEGCINRLMLEPTEKYILEFTQEVVEEVRD